MSALPHRTQNASCVFIVLVYTRFAASFPLLRSRSVADGDTEVTWSLARVNLYRPRGMAAPGPVVCQRIR